ncbi:hypothetical protein F7Q99_36240 [Streptomyces kaniharaensis]|uniref:Uncharacterized protein n=1 Tax=Streptomyces kaniharaensis TaxID=212423 RepID=A0A6N7L5Y3_9ACTN|nr:hypothetical protein [Streptomyces kaniharaensis]MQS17493.1 hypothetical protein [Streptomyces kaniharaensis]
MNVSTTAALLPVLSSALDTSLMRRTAAWKRRCEADSAVGRHQNQVARWDSAGREDLRIRAEQRLAAALTEQQDAHETFLQFCTEHVSLARAWELVAATLAPPATTAAAIAAHLAASSYDTGYAHARHPGTDEYETGRPVVWDREHALGTVLRHHQHGSHVWLDDAGAVRVAWSGRGAWAGPGGAFLSLIPYQ